MGTKIVIHKLTNQNLIFYLPTKSIEHEIDVEMKIRFVFQCDNQIECTRSQKYM